MKREFKFDQKDSYTKEELSVILEQHSSFLDVDNLRTQLDTTTSELETFKGKEFNTRLLGLASSLTDEDKVSGVLALTKDIKNEMSDEEIVSAFNKTIEANKYLTKAPISDREAKKDIKKGKPAPKKQAEKKTYKFMKG